MTSVEPTDASQSRHLRCEGCVQKADRGVVTNGYGVDSSTNGGGIMMELVFVYSWHDPIAVRRYQVMDGRPRRIGRG